MMGSGYCASFQEQLHALKLFLCLTRDVAQYQTSGLPDKDLSFIPRAVRKQTKRKQLWGWRDSSCCASVKAELRSLAPMVVRAYNTSSGEVETAASLGHTGG